MDDGGRPLRNVLYLVISGAPAPEGVPALVAACQAVGWRVVVFSTPTGTRFVDLGCRPRAEVIDALPIKAGAA